MNDLRDIPYSLHDMQLRDIDEVMVIEHLSFASPWTVRAYQYELVHNSFSQFLVVRQKPVLGAADPRLDPRRRFLFATRQPAPAPILGYGGLWLLVDEAHVSTIAVAPNWRGLGLGELLLVGLLERALVVGGEIATLEVRVSNQVAQNLYRKYLFQTVGRRRGYYRDNQEDALIMTTPPLQSAEFQETLVRHKQTLTASLEERAKRPQSDRASSLRG